MATVFLIVIYLSFISLGLPDSILGASWPVLQPELGAPLAAAGFISMTASASTIVSSLFSGYLLRRLGTGLVAFLSTLLTAAALFGFSFSQSVVWLFVLSVPLGLGAGAIDAGLNSYVALHYKARHMNWLHCFWGLGASAGPAILSYFLHHGSWRDGYRTIAAFQTVLVLVLLCALPMWRKQEGIQTAEEKKKKAGVSPFRLLSMRGARPAMLGFFAYCASEITLGLWGSSYLVGQKGVPAAEAALWVSAYYAGITIGRGAAGFAAMRLTNRQLIRTGQLIALFGSLLLMLPLPTTVSCCSLLLIGLGYAPIYPSMLHETPVRFGRENAGHLMGLQMALAYTGSTFMPSILGAAAGLTTIAILPYVLAALALVMLVSCEYVGRLLDAGKMGEREASLDFSVHS